ncbi:MAG: hypothetical protein Q8R37_05285 [Nanoarchaeota archaeon]|nr:hypothetical protein [Nanoarchaeota archaeon]
MKIIGIALIIVIMLSVNVLACKSTLITDSIVEGELKTYTVEDKNYEVILTYTDSDEAKFRVNGEVANKLKVGEIFSFSDNIELEVLDVTYQSYAGGVHSATFELRKIVPPAKKAPATIPEIIESVKSTLLSEMSETYALGEKKYSITPLSLSSDSVEFKVNTVLTGSMHEGESYLVTKDIEIAVIDIACIDYVNEIHSVEFELRKIVIPTLEPPKPIEVVELIEEKNIEENTKKIIQKRNSQPENVVDEDIPLPQPESSVKVIYVENITVNNTNAEIVVEDSFFKKFISKLKSWFS